MFLDIYHAGSFEISIFDIPVLWEHIHGNEKYLKVSCLLGLIPAHNSTAVWVAHGLRNAGLCCVCKAILGTFVQLTA
jgi:hypothetical protein